MVDRPVEWLVRRSIGLLGDWSDSRSACWVVGLMVDRPVGWLVGWSIGLLGGFSFLVNTSFRLAIVNVARLGNHSTGTLYQNTEFYISDGVTVAAVDNRL